jgi:hypothetical protein
LKCVADDFGTVYNENVGLTAERTGVTGVFAEFSFTCAPVDFSIKIF